ncbi:MAG TPA: aldo/keto reductase [Chitinophagaceae bacterium]|nr:aldo/keto reductase [Chitinophagaceae bacterium]
MLHLSSPVAGCMRWGKWGANYTTAEYRKMIDVCLQHGITSFDHADIYGGYTTEEEFGTALKEAPALRLQMQLISKCGIQMLSENRSHHQIKSYNTSAKHIIESTEKSLKNFGTDYLDILFIHRPDPLLNPVEVAEAITLLKQQGKIKHFGVSNFLPHQTEALRKYISIEFNQVEISIIHLTSFIDGTLDNCLQHKIIPMAWAPLGGGMFTDETHHRFRSITATAFELAEKYNTGINQILVAWLLAHPSKIIPVVGTTKVERLLQAKEANKIILEREDWFKLWVASTGEDVA